MKVSFTVSQLNKFREEGYGSAPLVCEMLSDAATPIECLKAIGKAGGKRGKSFLFESIEGGEKWARYSFLGFSPVAEIFLSDKVMTISEEGKTRTISTCDPNAEIRGILKNYKSPKTAGLPPFTGGFVGYFSYEYFKYYEKADFLPAGEFGDCRLFLFDKVIAYDNLKQKIYIIVNVKLSERLDAEYAAAIEEIEEIRHVIYSGCKDKCDGAEMIKGFSAIASREEYEKKVEKAKNYVYEGDIFQCVPSNLWTAEINGGLLNTYRVLRTTNPSPYMIYMNMGDAEIAGASPETLVKVTDGKVTTFPIAGTRPRGANEEQDKLLEEQLLADEKEIAEHNMLVDLGRNDLGKVCKFGTVKVKEYKKVYRFSHVMHITSSVSGELREDKDALDALSATLPAGTLSGAPKLRAMQIISELEEGRPRGIYGGAVGYADFTGNGDFCIAIRTAARKGNKVYVRAGGGIVEGSVPEREFEETVNKSAAVREAVEKSGGIDL